MGLRTFFAISLGIWLSHLALCTSSWLPPKEAAVQHGDSHDTQAQNKIKFSICGFTELRGARDSEIDRGKAPSRAYIAARKSSLIVFHSNNTMKEYELWGDAKANNNDVVVPPGAAMAETNNGNSIELTVQPWSRGNSISLSLDPTSIPKGLLIQPPHSLSAWPIAWAPRGSIGERGAFFVPAINDNERRTPAVLMVTEDGIASELSLAAEAIIMEVTDLTFDSSRGQLLILCAPTKTIHAVSASTGNVLGSWQLNPSPELSWEPSSIGMVDGGEVVAALGSHNDESNSGNGLSVVYLCRGLKTVKALGNALQAMAEVPKGASAESEAFGKGLRNFDLSTILSWPKELMDEGGTCCFFGSVCDSENCLSLRKSGWVVQGSVAEPDDAYSASKDWPVEWMDESMTCCVLGDTCTEWHCQQLQDQGWSIPGARAESPAPTAWDLDSRTYHTCPMHTLEAPSGASGAKGVTYMPSSATLWAVWERCAAIKDSPQHPCATEHSLTGTLLKTIQLEDSEEGNRLRGISLAGIVATGDREIAVARNDPFEVVVYDVSNYGSAAVVERQTYDGLEQEARSLAYDGAAGVFYTTAGNFIYSFSLSGPETIRSWEANVEDPDRITGAYFSQATQSLYVVTTSGDEFGGTSSVRKLQLGPGLSMVEELGRYSFQSGFSQGLTFTEDEAILFTMEQSSDASATNIASLAVDECPEAREALLTTAVHQAGSP